MKKIIIIEDEKEYRERWNNFFSEYGPYLDVEVEIPDEITDLPSLIGRGMIEKVYFILDEDIAGFFSMPVIINGYGIANALTEVGYCSKVLLSFERELRNEHVLANVGTFFKFYASEHYRFKTLCFVSSLLSDVKYLENYYRVHEIVKGVGKYGVLSTPESYDDKVVEAVNLVMRAWFKKNPE